MEFNISDWLDSSEAEEYSKLLENQPSREDISAYAQVIFDKIEYWEELASRRCWRNGE